MSEFYRIIIPIQEPTHQSDSYFIPTNSVGYISAARSPEIVQSSDWCIFNPVGSEKILYINSIEQNGLSAKSNISALSTVFLRTTSSCDEETNCSYLKLDSSLSDLPSQVKIVKNANGVTYTNAPFRRTTLQYGNQIELTQVGLWGSYHLSFGNLKNGLLYNSKNSNVQDYTLREGEGLTFGLDSTMNSFSMPFEISMTISDGTNKYYIREVVYVFRITGHITIFNGVGSGVVLEVSNFLLKAFTDNNSIERESPSIQKVYELFGGFEITPTPLDTNETSFINSFQVRSYCHTILSSADSYGGITIKSVDNLLRSTCNTDMGADNFNSFPCSPVSNKLITHKSSSLQRIVLREGEGIAITNIQYNTIRRLYPLSFSLMDWAVNVEVEDVSVSTTVSYGFVE